MAVVWRRFREETLRPVESRFTDEGVLAVHTLALRIPFRKSWVGAAPYL